MRLNSKLHLLYDSVIAQRPFTLRNMLTVHFDKVDIRKIIKLSSKANIIETTTNQAL